MKRFLWLTPFICFLVGYQSMRIMYHVDEIKTPSLIGLQLTDAFTILSHHNLNPRILQEKEDPDIPAGTILSQIPTTDSFIKPQQSVFLVVSKTPPIPRAPYCINRAKDVISKDAAAQNIRTKFFALHSIYPTDRCFAQYPAHNDPVTDGTMIMYLSAGNHKPVILPNFKGLSLDEVREYLENHPVTIQASHNPAKSHTDCSSCIITDQRPLAGSFVVLDERKPLQLHFQVKPG